MGNQLNAFNADCCSPTGKYEICGCSDGVAYIQLTVVGGGTVQTIWLNTETGDTFINKPAGFTTGNCSDAATKDNLRFSSAAPTGTTPFAAPLDGNTTIVTDDGTQDGAVVGYWRFDAETATWKEIPVPKDILWADVTTDPTAIGNAPGPRFEINAAGKKFFIDSAGRAEPFAVEAEVIQTGGTTPTETGNTTQLNTFFEDQAGDTYFVDSKGKSILLERKDTGECKGMHQELDVSLSAGAPLTITHNLNLGNPRSLGYSVIGVDGTTVGDWPTGVRFINHTANTVDVVADTGSGVVDIVLSNVECLGWVKKGAPVPGMEPALAYPTPKTFTRNVAITPIRPSVTLSGCEGTKAFTVSPALPAGLAISQTTGIIAGTPTTAASASDFVVTVTQGTCTATATVNLTIAAAVAAPSGMSFVPASRSFPVGSAITTFGPTLTSDGGATITYSISPSFPAGLSFNSVTGAISGTPTSVSSATTYTMTATNSAGSTSATFTLDVYAALTDWVTVTSSGTAQDLGSGISATTVATEGTVDLVGNAPFAYDLATRAGNAPSSFTTTLSSGLKNVRLTYGGLDSPARENITLEINGAPFVPTAAQFANNTGTTMNATTGSVSATSGTGRLAVIELLDLATAVTSIKIINKGATAGFWANIRVQVK